MAQMKYYDPSTDTWVPVTESNPIPVSSGGSGSSNNYMEFVDLSQAQMSVIANGGIFNVDYSAPTGYISRIRGLYLVYRGVDLATTGTHEFTVQQVDVNDPDNAFVAKFGAVASASQTLNLTQSEMIEPADTAEFSFTPSTPASFSSAIANTSIYGDVGLRFHYVNGGDVDNTGDFICKIALEHQSV